MRNIVFIIISILLISTSCNNNDFEISLDSITYTDIENIVKEIGSDKYLGRKPFSEGEKLSIEYLKREYERIGIKPINGTYFQKVPMVEVTGKVSDFMIFVKGNEKITLKYDDEFVAFSRRLEKKIELKDIPLIFAGYGIVAPEYNWNDYKNIDVKNKIVLVLVNDPGFDTKDDNVFKGNEMTYYGRWIYKYEEAARQGAAGCIIIHRTDGAGYPWGVVRNGAVALKLYPKPDDDYLSRCKMEGWITGDAAEKLLSFAGYDNSLYQKVLEKDFTSFQTNVSVSIDIQNSYRFDVSNNVWGIIEGTDLKDEIIVYSAHWDHLGVGKPVNGDSIYNGAVDNGTSLAWMLEIAEAFTKLKEKQRRSIVIFAPTAEESGLCGSEYFINNCPFELSKIVANINNDLMLPYGKMKDVMITGYGQSELDDYVRLAAKKQDRYVVPDPNAHTGMFHRSDHASFAKSGIPSLFVRGNCDHIINGKEWMQEKEEDWINNFYHKPADEFDPEWWDLTGVVDDAKLLFHVGYMLANEEVYPQWHKASEFKSFRDSYFKK